MTSQTVNGTKFNIPIDFTEQVARQRCVVFAGPGVSNPSGDRLAPPGPALLALELATRLGGQFDYYSLPWIAQVYADRNSPHALREYIARRLNSSQYRPTLTHYVMAQLPFHLIVYTAQDALLLDAYQRVGVTVNHVIDGESLSYGGGRTIIQLYGTATRPETLLLTEDERRRVFDGYSELDRFLRDRAETHSLLFLGYTLDDPFFREFYSNLRPQVRPHSPRVYLVQEDADEDDTTYWAQRNATILHVDALAFLKQLGDHLIRNGTLSTHLNMNYEEPPPITEEERSQREETIRKFTVQLGLVNPVESRSQLQPVANSLNLLNQVIAEENMLEHEARSEDAIHTGTSREAYTAQILHQQGNIAWAEGNHNHARENFEEAIRRAPELSDAYLSLFYLLVETGELEDATRLYRQFVTHFPDQAVLPDRYRVEKVLGQIDVGLSYCVIDSERDKRVTATILRSALSRPSETFNTVIGVLETIDCRRISRLLEQNRYRGRSYLITEYIEGSTLRDRLRATGPIPLDNAMEIFNQVAEALEAGHEQGVPDLNLQPGNVVLTSEGAVLVNYGFTRLLQKLNLPQKTGTLSATAYQAPEQWLGEVGDPRSDVYGLGTILYEMSAGRPPGVGTFQPIGELYPEYGEAFDILIDRARAFDPDRRFQTVSEMRREVNRIALSTRKYPPGQYIRLALSHLSNLYSTVSSWKGIAIILIMLSASVMLEAGTAVLPVGLKEGLRVFWLLVINSLVTGTLGYYIVRETARQEGFGSLLASGRGMGAILGWVLALWLYRITDWSFIRLWEVTVGEFAGYVFLSVAVVIVVTFASLLHIRFAGSLSEQWWRRYTVGFYGSYILLVIFIIVLAVIGKPFGIFKY